MKTIPITVELPGMKMSVEKVPNFQGGIRNFRTFTVDPVDDEIEQIFNRKDLFADLQHMNLILTNACNLKCTYCYEQHKKDFGRFSPEKLLTAYDFLLNINEGIGKMFQFFGGEPLIHKKLIIGFVDQHKEYLEANKAKQMVSMITNGLLLDPEFIEGYFKYNFTCASISLDTFDAEKDYRDLTQKDIDRILEMISLIPQEVKDNHRLSIRCTITEKSVDSLDEFIDDLFARGIRSMVIHPLTMSSKDGFINWPAEKWTLLSTTISKKLLEHQTLSIQFSEGVGVKGDSNCMIGSDMIAIDGSGDFSGCYFFTNLKDQATHTILGNVFTGEVYTNRYKAFKDEYLKMFEAEPCKSCDIQNFCYQCPAGNMNTGNKKMFRPDEMCKQITQLFVDLQSNIVKHDFIDLFHELANYAKENTLRYTTYKSLMMLMFKEIHSIHFEVNEMDDLLEEMFDYNVGQLCSYFAESYKVERQYFSPEDTINEVLHHHQTMSLDEFREFVENMFNEGGIPYGDLLNVMNEKDRNLFSLTAIHMQILNTKVRKLNKKMYKHVKS